MADEAFLRIVSRWHNQPPGHTRISKSNPLAKGIVAAYLPGQSLFNLASNTTTLDDQGTAPVAGVGAYGKQWVGNASRYATATSNPPFLDTMGKSMGAIFKPNGTAVEVVMSIVSAGHSAIELYTDTLTKMYARRVDAGPTITVQTATSPENIWQIAVGVSHTQTNHTLHVKPFGGVTDDFTTATDIGASSTDLLNTTIGGYYATGIGNQYDGDIALCVFWDRSLSEAEAHEFNDNPWQIFDPITRRIQIGTVAAGGLPLPTRRNIDGGMNQILGGMQ